MSPVRVDDIPEYEYPQETKEQCKTLNCAGLSHERKKN